MANSSSSQPIRRVQARLTGVRHRRYLVTGGAGFIGSHLVAALVERGERVAVLDDLSTGSLENLAGVLGHARLSFHHGSARDPRLVRALVKNAEIVVHLAASVGVSLVIERPLASFLNNVHSVLVVLEACAELGRRVLVTSSSEIYGKNVDDPVREDADRVLGSLYSARWAYSTAKAVGEIVARGYAVERGTPAIVVRLFNVAGPRQSGAYGMVLPRFVRQGLCGEDITVFGDGEQRRCFCHVADTVGALLALLDHPASAGEVFNVGATDEVSVNELARRVEAATGSQSRIVHIPYADAYEEGFDDMRRRVPDVGKLLALTGWRAVRTLDEIIADVVVLERQRMLRGVRGSP